jgi:hypothetical protein
VVFNVLPTGQDVPKGGLLIAMICDSVKLLLLSALVRKLFTPMMVKNSLSPSFGKSGKVLPKASV